jgi:hypothetical protein
MGRGLQTCRIGAFGKPASIQFLLTLLRTSIRPEWPKSQCPVRRAGLCHTIPPRAESPPSASPAVYQPHRDLWVHGSTPATVPGVCPCHRAPKETARGLAARGRLGLSGGKAFSCFRARPARRPDARRARGKASSSHRRGRCGDRISPSRDRRRVRRRCRA